MRHNAVQANSAAGGWAGKSVTGCDALLSNPQRRRLLCRTLHCGNGDWQRDYAQLHARMLRKEIDPRYIVAHGENGGDALPMLPARNVQIYKLCRSRMRYGQWVPHDAIG